MWTAIAYVSSGVTLVAFVVAVVASLVRRYGLRQKNLIESAPEAERAALIDKTLEFFNVDTTGLTKQQKFDLARQQIQAKADRFRITAMIVAVVAVLSAGVLVVALIIAPSALPVTTGGSNDNLYDEYGSYLRKHVQLSRPGEPQTDSEYLGIAVADFSRDGETLFAELKRVGGYQTPWQKDEAEQALRDRANNLKDDHPSDQVRNLADIQLARVTNLVTMNQNLRESLVESVDRPPLREIYELRQKPPDVSQLQNQIRYFIDSLPDVDDAETIVGNAFQQWSRALPVAISQTTARDEATLIVTTELLDGPEGRKSDTHVGPPTVYDQLSMVFDSGEEWDPQLLSHVACHEFGHILGLRHTNAPGQLMSPIINLQLDGPQLEDIERAQAIWGTRTGT